MIYVMYVKICQNLKLTIIVIEKNDNLDLILKLAGQSIVIYHRRYIL